MAVADGSLAIEASWRQRIAWRPTLVGGTNCRGCDCARSAPRHPAAQGARMAHAASSCTWRCAPSEGGIFTKSTPCGIVNNCPANVPGRLRVWSSVGPGSDSYMFNTEANSTPRQIQHGSNSTQPPDFRLTVMNYSSGELAVLSAELRWADPRVTVRSAVPLTPGPSPQKGRGVDEWKANSTRFKFNTTP
jgi:hypothetical protein